MGCLFETLAATFDVVRLTEQMCHGEAEIERRVAKVDHFMVEQYQPITVDDDVLRAVIAVYQRESGLARFAYQRSDECSGFRNASRGVAVVRFKSQCLE